MEKQIYEQWQKNILAVWKIANTHKGFNSVRKSGSSNLRWAKYQNRSKKFNIIIFSPYNS